MESGKHELKKVTLLAPVEIPLGKKTCLLDATRLSTITSTRPVSVALEDLGTSFRTKKSGPTCVNAHVWPAKTNRSTTSDEYGKRGLAMIEDEPKMRAESYGEANHMSIDFAISLGRDKRVSFGKRIWILRIRCLTGTRTLSENSNVIRF